MSSTSIYSPQALTPSKAIIYACRLRDVTGNLSSSTGEMEQLRMAASFARHFPTCSWSLGHSAAFANFPPVIESEIEFICACIARAEKTMAGEAKMPFVEVTREVETDWAALSDQLTEPLVFRSTASWILGSNVPGRNATTNFYFGGLGSFRKWVQPVITDDFRGFVAGFSSSNTSHCELCRVGEATREV